MTSTTGALLSFPALDQENRIRSAWERLVRLGTLTPNAVRTPVEDSWRRCYQAGVDPHCANLSPVRAAALPLQQRQRELADASMQMMEQAQAALAESGTIMILADQTGVVLEAQGDRSTLEEATEIRLVPGVDWSELSRGTNGIGTALYTNGPVQIHALEHYCVGIRPWSCSATVVRDPTRGEVLGAVSVSGLSPASNPQWLALAVVAAGSIETALASREVERRERLLKYESRRPLKGSSAGLLYFDRRGILVKADTRAARALATVGVELNLKGRLRIDALDTSNSAHAGGVGLPDWLDSDWIEAVTEGGERLGSVVLLPERLARNRVLAKGGLPAYKLRRATQFIEAHIDQPIRLEAVAAAVDVSPFHFHRQFKRSTGSTPHQYIVQLRMERAKALLCESELPLVEVAARVGFADQSHFSSIFRRMTSMTPRRYRNAMSA
jgi:AraC-like DNA-binding protein